MTFKDPCGGVGPSLPALDCSQFLQLLDRASASFSSSEIKTALISAAKWKVQPRSNNPIRRCFTGISDQQERFYTLMSIIGASTLICYIAFFIYLRKISGQSG